MSTRHPADSSLVLTIDVGSSSLRANLFTEDARQLTEFDAQHAYDTRLPAGSGVEIDPQVLFDCLFSTIDKTLALAGSRATQIAGVGTCSLVSNVMGIDRAGKPTTPIYTWADTRPSEDAARLRSELHEVDLRERTGSAAIHTSYLPARLRWLQRTQPDAYARTATWITLGDWLQLRLFGRIGQSLSVAAWGGLLNRHSLRWDADLLAHLGIGPDRLPPLVGAGHALSGLRVPYAGRWPALRDVPWLPCVADGVASNLGSGCLLPDEVAVQIGTSGAMRAVVPGTPEHVPPGLWCYRVDGASSLLGGALSEGGNLFEWLRETLRIDDWRAAEQEAAALPPDSHGLTLLPFVAGERSPGWHAEARATISGLTLQTRPADIIRAAQEAIAYRLAQVFGLLRAALPPVRRVVASGGALLSTTGWMQMLADVLNCPVTASLEPQASSRGAAMLVIRHLGLVADLSALPASLGQTYQPDADRHQAYKRGMERQQELYDALVR
jgi:gluconokinase